jgi:hypothetical protein
VLKLAADENFNNAILRGVLRRLPEVDVVRLQDVGLSGVDDREVLAWAAVEQRIVLSHDVTTLSKFAIERLDSGRQMAGLFLVGYSAPIGVVIEDIVLLATCSQDGEWEGQVVFLPL